MVVVVIIVILAAIAIPSYNGFQERARSSEAKVQLSAIYTAEKAFQAEWSTFTSDLVAAGYDIPAVASLKTFKNIGFSATQKPADVPHIAASSSGTGNFSTATPPAGACIVSAPAVFKACAEKATPASDSWSITQDKVLASY